MIDLYTDFSLDTVNTFFVFGAMLGAIYYFILEVLLRLSILFSKNGLSTLIKGRYKEFSTLIKMRGALNLNIKLHDLVHAIFIFISGSFLVLLNYVFVNGTLRIYLIICILGGIYFSKIITKSKIYSIVLNLFFSFSGLILFVLFYPIKLIYRIITKKAVENYSTPLI